MAPDRVVDTTAHVLEAACAVDVDRFAHPSTDKAADPVNALGSTERTAERLTTEAGLLRRRVLAYAGR